MLSSHHIKDSYSSAEMTESQLIGFMGKKKPILDMMWGGKKSQLIILLFPYGETEQEL